MFTWCVRKRKCKSKKTLLMVRKEKGDVLRNHSAHLLFYHFPVTLQGPILFQPYSLEFKFYNKH